MLQTSANIAGNAIKLRTFTAFADVEREWRGFQDRAVMTPYQQFDWLEPWFRHVGRAASITPLIVIGEANGRPAFLWPLGLQTISGLRICRWLGGKQCNYNFGLYDPDILPRLDAATIRAFLRDAGELCGGIDAFELYNQPLAWSGYANPFAGLERQASPSPCYRMALQPDFQALEKSSRNPRSIRSLQRKARKLAEAHGEIRLASPTDPAEYTAIFDEFMAQRAVRFGEMGLPNIFAGEALGAFLREVSRLPESGGPPVMAFHALFAGEAVCATYGGVMQNGHYSCFANSVDLERFGKFSPGDLILTRLIEHCCSAGFGGVDLGMGLERYKLSWCEEDPLFDCFVPQSMLGGAHTVKTKALLSLKRTIRSSPKAWALAKSVRKRLFGA